DGRVHYPQQVTGAMGLPILGAVPHLARNGGTRKPDGVMQVVEAVRGIRLNVQHAHGTGPVVVTVTSAGRSDGKSFLASNLALAFADAGSRTLLVDGDIRCGRLHRVRKLARKPGLTDLLAGDATPEQVLQGTPYRTLTLLAAGTRTLAGPGVRRPRQRHAGSAGGSSRSNQNCVPQPGRVSRHSSEPMARTRRRVSARPSPVPEKR